jgi:hypothetical protein
MDKHQPAGFEDFGQMAVLGQYYRAKYTIQMAFSTPKHLLILILLYISPLLSMKIMKFLRA